MSVLYEDNADKTPELCRFLQISRADKKRLFSACKTLHMIMYIIPQVVVKPDALHHKKRKNCSQFNGRVQYYCKCLYIA